MEDELISMQPSRHGKLTGIYNDMGSLWSEVIGYIIFAAIYWGIAGGIMWLILR